LFDLVIEGKVPVEGELVEAAVCIEGGSIADVRRITPSFSETGEIHRLGRHILLPGFIDSHVHMRDPGMTAKEDFATGTISAAFGGVTTVIDMPNTIPPVRDRSTLDAKEAEVGSKAYVDYGLYLAIDEGMDPDLVAALILGNGIPPVAFKAFLGETTGSLSFGEIGNLERYGPVLSGTGAVVAAHAEDGNMFTVPKGGRSETDIVGVHDASRPSKAEASAIVRAVEGLGQHADRLHILHVSSSRGLDAARNTPASIEVTPHHLLLDIAWAREDPDLGPMCKVNPPLRSREDRAALWDAVRSGRVDTLGSDHAPHLPEEKAKGLGSPSGIPGVETMAPRMLSKVSERKLTLQRLIDLLCTNPARRFSLARKGSLTKGMDADIVAVDPHANRKVRSESLHSKCGWSPYEGMVANFPSRVYSRGELIVESEQASSKVGRGRNIRA